MNDTAETKKMDVIAVLDRHIARNIERGAAKGSPSDIELRQARAAVAELIEAAREVKTDAEVLGMTTNRLTAALDRVGGAA